MFWRSVKQAVVRSDGRIEVQFAGKICPRRVVVGGIAGRPRVRKLGGRRERPKR